MCERERNIDNYTNERTAFVVADMSETFHTSLSPSATGKSTYLTWIIIEEVFLYSLFPRRRKYWMINQNAFRVIYVSVLWTTFYLRIPFKQEQKK